MKTYIIILDKRSDDKNDQFFCNIIQINWILQNSYFSMDFFIWFKENIKNTQATLKKCENLEAFLKTIIETLIIAI